MIERLLCARSPVRRCTFIISFGLLFFFLSPHFLPASVFLGQSVNFFPSDLFLLSDRIKDGAKIIDLIYINFQMLLVLFFILKMKMESVHVNKAGSRETPSMEYK